MIAHNEMTLEDAKRAALEKLARQELESAKRELAEREQEQQRLIRQAQAQQAEREQEAENVLAGLQDLYVARQSAFMRICDEVRKFAELENQIRPSLVEAEKLAGFVGRMNWREGEAKTARLRLRAGCPEKHHTFIFDRDSNIEKIVASFAEYLAQHDLR